MQPSSRTPDGNDGYCIICGQFVRLAPSVTAGDATCPCCGVLLWFDRAEESSTLMKKRREVLTALSSSELAAAKDVLLQASSGDAEDSAIRDFLHAIDLEIESR
ncbi:MAG: hypothetical protein JNL58_21070 [Planctomyces sp.]|nr:hypothetical protein [Planctomyces sp.]